MKILKITLTLFILLCSFTPVYAARHKDTPDYRLEYLNLKWWENYEDPILNDYLVKAYQNNQDLKIAAINVKQAQQVAKQSLAQELPHLGIAGNYFRDFHSSDVRFGEVLIPNYNQSNFVLPLTMTYELDLWGENRLKTKSINKQVDMIKQDERAAYIALTSTLASTYYNLIKLDKLIKNQTELVKLQKTVVTMTEKKYKNGLAPVTEFMQEKQLLTNFEETLELYKDRYDIIEREMVVLLGDRTNNTVDHTDYNDIKLVSIPDNIAAEVIQFRPDMAKTELYIQKTGFDVKAARRDFLPKILLYGQVGFNAYQLSNIFTGNTFKSAAGFAPSLDLFSGGAKMAHFRYNKLELEKAQQMYEKTILTSLQEVNNSLGIAHTNQKNYKSSLERYNLEKDKYNLSARKLEIGAQSILDNIRDRERVLVTEKDEVSNKIDYIIATINVYKAIGGKDYNNIKELL